MKRRSWILLIFYMAMIDLCVCEVMEIKNPTPKSPQVNSSAILDQAILHANTDSLDYYTSSSKDPLNLTSVSNGTNNTKILLDKNESRNFVGSENLQNDSSLGTKRTSKSLYVSGNVPLKTLERNQIISTTGQLPQIYPNWYGISIQPNNQTSPPDNTEENEEEIYNIKNNKNENDKNVPLIREKIFRRRQERQHFDGTKRQYNGYDEIMTNYEQDEHHNKGPEKYYTSTNYELENTDNYGQRFSDPNGRYTLENYNSYGVDNNYKNNRYYENTVSNSYAGNSVNFPARGLRPNYVYPRYTMDSYEDPADRGGSTSSIVAIFSAIGSSLLQLFKIGLGSGLSIALSILAIKLFLIPLKIFKFIKIIKILLKLLFVVPFILRIFTPTVFSAIGFNDPGFTNKMGDIPSPEGRDVIEESNPTNNMWNNFMTNLTNVFPDVINAQKCPSRLACELGSYLGSRSNIPEKLTSFLSKGYSEESTDSTINKERSEKEIVVRAFLKALTQRWTFDRCDVFTCGISL